MKIKIKADELINILIQKNEASLLKKYGLDKEMVVKLREALQKGNWRFLN